MYLTYKRRLSSDSGPREWIFSLYTNIPNRSAYASLVPGLFLPPPGSTIIGENGLRILGEEEAREIVREYGPQIGLNYVGLGAKTTKEDRWHIIRVKRYGQTVTYCSRSCTGRWIKHLLPEVCVCLRCQYEYWRDCGDFNKEKKEAAGTFED